MTWIQTYTGKQFWPLQPSPEDVCVEDIAHALSLVCRFNGHCRVFYSVAQHSILVADELMKRQVMVDASKVTKHNGYRMALLHDAAEAYLGDQLRPIKQELDDFAARETALLRVIYEAMGVTQNYLPHFATETAIKHCDNVLLATEARDLMGPPPAEWVPLPDPLEMAIEPWGPEKAEREWLAAWRRTNCRTERL